MAYIRVDVASSGAMEFREPNGILFPRVEMNTEGTSVRCDCNQDGSMFFTTSAGERHELGPRIPDNPIVPRWLPHRNQFGVFYCARVDDPQGVDPPFSQGRIAYVDAFGARTGEQGAFDASLAGSQGIQDAAPDGTVHFNDVENKDHKVDGIWLQNWKRRGDYEVGTINGEESTNPDLYGVSVYDHGLRKWFKASTTIVQLNPGIAENGTVAVSGDPGGFVVREDWLTRPFDPHAVPEPPEPEPEPIPPTPEPPTPTPEEPMIAYNQPVSGFLPGELVNHPDGAPYLAIRKPNGKVVAVTPEGKIEERDSAGAWERFVKSKNGATLIADRGEGRVYVLPLAEW